MKKYQITHNGFTGNVPCPDVLPEPGAKLRVAHSFVTLGNRGFMPGDTLTLVRRTEEAPHDRHSSLGNWVVTTKYDTTIWTNIEWMIYDGYLEVV